MARKSVAIFILLLCFGMIMVGCPKKTLVKDEPSSQAAAAAAKKADADRMAAKAAEDARARAAEDARIKASDDARKAQAEAQAKRDLEKSMVAKKEPGIEGTAFASNLLKDIHFDYDKFEIRPVDAEILKANADVLKKNPGVKVQIEGHCDERGTSEYNLALGERRATSTKKYLISLGIPESRISTISYGEEKPLDPAKNEAAFSKNRRAATIILSK